METAPVSSLKSSEKRRIGGIKPRVWKRSVKSPAFFPHLPSPRRGARPCGRHSQRFSLPPRTCGRPRCAVASQSGKAKWHFGPVKYEHEQRVSLLSGGGSEKALQRSPGSLLPLSADADEFVLRWPSHRSKPPESARPYLADSVPATAAFTRMRDKLVEIWGPFVTTA